LKGRARLVLAAGDGRGGDSPHQGLGAGAGAEEAIAPLAGAPMFIHGYLIVFRHSRLF